jgi:hypothetical protein
MRTILSITVGFLALIGVAASVFHYLVEPYNPGFLEFPVVTALHVVPGAVYLALAPLQFVKRLRTRRWLGYHRFMGRVLVTMGLVIGVTALFMGFVFPAGGWIESVVIGVFGSLFLAALVLGVVHGRARRITLHREWMIRAFATGLAIATTRLIAIPLLFIFGEAVDGVVAVLLPFAVAFIVHLALAELWIRHTRRPRSRKRPTKAMVHETAVTSGD